MAHLPPLLPAESVHDRRHVTIWVALTFAAGAVNAAALAACQAFVTHVTGTLTRIGADFEQPTLLLEYVVVVVCFVLGAMTSVFLLDGRRLRHRQPWPAAPLVLVSLVQAGAASAGLAGLFGPFGTTVETLGDFALLSVLGFAMGLQNAAVASTTGMIVRTTHMTGPLTDFSIALATSMSHGPATLVEGARRSVRLRGAKILAFVSGALVASAIAPHLGYATFFLPAAITLVAAIRLYASLRGQRLASTSTDLAPRDAVTASRS
ncbi:MAG: DUF1275 domain-containing protein [Deltaproteobacteria bacterium]|nr:DUF1275 domain-containing protein [Deltaproteobacteria bacterium]